ncbi:SDR family NAD(P)-dependent oxidoreductase [Sphingopyxis sp. GW247-27LB]|uniref:SDR family NAD(P)-dependent oxidoreductase n=1 Tax=Sphingopyxis sp. GW247-27LB TaxID=2012632 RepID=UPI000BA75E18|nr:SDR family oxidoreductase [Sphingopyxis sp. GW247-27LB]PAL21488.1 short-chain dehydrogenase [Sphingopyxis sp. GW247-27LB]
MKRLDGKVAIITGGAGAIGSATVERFVAEGARVAVADNRIELARDVASRFGDKAFAVHLDAADADSVKQAIDVSVAHFDDGLDILFNTIALTTSEFMRKDTTAVDVPLEVWDQAMRVNATGLFLACRFAIPYMIARGGGSIINTSAGSALAGDLTRIAYGSSKAAVIAMSEHIAVQYGRDGIRCNIICPGVIFTEERSKPIADLIETMKEHILTPRFGRPPDMAALATYFAADESAYVTGQTICCDGGQLIHQPHVADTRKLIARGVPG